MFVDWKNTPPPPPWRPEPRRKTKRDELVLLRLLGLALLAVALAPFGGASILHVLAYALSP